MRGKKKHSKKSEQQMRLEALALDHFIAAGFAECWVSQEMLDTEVRRGIAERTRISSEQATRRVLAGDYD